MVRLLCEAGADEDKAMQGGDTALMAACERGCLEVAPIKVKPFLGNDFEC